MCFVKFVYAYFTLNIFDYIIAGVGEFDFYLFFKSFTIADIRASLKTREISFGRLCSLQSLFYL